MRIGDAERNQAVDALQTHHQAGRLSLDEFEERMGTALQAKTGGELAALFTDLPEPRFAQAQTPLDQLGFGGFGFGPAFTQQRTSASTHYMMEQAPARPVAKPSRPVPIVLIVIAAIIGLSLIGHGGGFLLFPAIAVFFLIRADRRINSTPRRR